MSAWLWISECRALGNAEVRSRALLCDSERARHERIHNPLRRKQFLIGRLMLREMLAHRFNENIENWPLTEQSGQPPQLMRSLPSPAAFSIAHSHHRVICLLAEGNHAGCDIEFMGRMRDMHGIAASILGAETALALRRQDKDRQQAFFYRAWTRHEAAFKHGGNNPTMFTTTLDVDYCLSLALEQTQNLTTCRLHWEPGQATHAETPVWEHTPGSSSSTICGTSPRNHGESFHSLT